MEGGVNVRGLREERRNEIGGKGVFLGQSTPGRLPFVQEELTYNVIVIARFGRGNTKCCNHTHARDTLYDACTYVNMLIALRIVWRSFYMQASEIKTKPDI